MRFRWSYIALPLAIFFIAAVSAVVFYGKLPPQVGYRFSGGAAISETGRGVFLGWSLGLQLLLSLAAVIIVLLVVYVGRRMQLADNQLNRTLTGIMGNIVAMPQLIICYAVLDIFLYNIYHKSLPPLWIFGIAILFIGGIVIFSVFIIAFLKSRAEKIQEISGSKSNGREQTR
jgi:hypothetical protein